MVQLTPSQSRSSSTTLDLEFEDADPGFWADFTSEEDRVELARMYASDTDIKTGISNEEEAVGYELVDFDFNYTTSRLVEGVYTMRNSAASETMMDLSGGDSKSIIGFPGHGFENQQVRNTCHCSPETALRLYCTISGVSSAWVLAGLSGVYIPART